MSELRLLSAIVRHRDISPVIAANIDKSLFKSELHEKVFTFLINHHRKFGRIPPAKSISEQFPGLKLLKTDESVEEAVELFISRVAKSELIAVWQEVAKDIQNDAPDVISKALDALVKVNALGTRHIISVKEGMKARIESYAQRPTTAFKGIPYGIDILDDHTRGIHKGEIVTVVGSWGSGKSNILRFFAANAFLADQKCLVFSMEETSEQYTRRMDALTARVHYDRLKRGTLTTEEIDKWKQNAELVVARKGDVLIIGDEKHLTPAVLLSYIEQIRPDMIFIDGIYHMAKSGTRTPQWEQISAICGELKDIARYKNIAILGIAQGNRQSIGQRMSADTISYQSIAQYSDVCLGISPEEDFANSHVLPVQLIKNRDGIQKIEFNLYADFGEMEIHQI